MNDKDNLQKALKKITIHGVEHEGKEGSAIQKDLIKIFDLYKNEGKSESKKLFDKYYQMDIELDHITFFATVNYPEKLSPLLKLGVNMRTLEDYSNEDKQAILRLK